MVTEKTVLITGAARRVGRRIALDFADQGYRVWVHYHTGREDALSLCREIRNAGGQADALGADLSDCTQIRELFARTAAFPPSVLVFNSSVFLHRDILGTTPEEWDGVFDVNLKAAWYASLCFAERCPGKNGNIILIGDAKSGSAYRKHAVYGLSRAVLPALTRQLAEALAPGIAVNLISPGLLMKGDDESVEQWEKRKAAELIHSEDPVGELLRGIRFLLASSAATGSELVLDGGCSLRKF